MNKNAKILIIITVVFLVLILGGKTVLNSKNKSANAAQLFNRVIGESSYSGEVNLSVGGKTVTAQISKNNTSKLISVTNPVKVAGVFFEDDKETVLNNSVINAENGGILTLHKVSVDEKTRSRNTNKTNFLKDMVSLFTEENGVVFETNESKFNMTVDGAEAWSAFNSSVVSCLNENKDAIISRYEETEAVGAEIQNLIEVFTKFKDTQTPSNSLFTEIWATENGYAGSFSISINFDILPEYISQEYFDSNRLKITGDFVITKTGEGTEIKKPAGINYDATENNLPVYFKSLWELIFSQVDYIPLNNVEINNNTVTNTNLLGEITEKSVFVFDQDGLKSGTYTIEVPNEAIRDSYLEKYGGKAKENQDGTFVITIECSEAAIYSLNKIANNANDFGKYLNSYKGGDIIV